MISELRRDYHDHLGVLHDRVVEMGEIVVQGIRDATAALLRCDERLAEAVIANDGAIDSAYPWVEQEVFEVVARQAPVARDLRFVIATFRIAANLERCGDLVASIARRAARLERAALSEPVRTVLEDMGHAAELTMERALQAYRVVDADIASSVAVLDVRVDDLQRELLRELIARPVDVESVIDLALVARFYERVGDHAVVIAERVRFVAVGSMDAGDRDDG